MVLLIAAYAKIISPSEELYVLDYLVSCFEIVFLAFLILYRYQIQMWLIGTLLFFSWGGYALFWYLAELPCTCMGSAVSIPDGFSLCLDSFFTIVCLSIAFLLGAQMRQLFLTAACGTLFAVAGFGFAQWIYLGVLLD